MSRAYEMKVWNRKGVEQMSYDMSEGAYEQWVEGRNETLEKLAGMLVKKGYRIEVREVEREG